MNARPKPLVVWWRRNHLFLFKVAAMAAATVWLAQAANRHQLATLFPAIYMYTTMLLQFAFYLNIVFPYTIQVTSLLLFARVYKEYPLVTLDDYKGHQGLLDRAHVWINDMQHGTPRAILLAGRAGAGKRYLCRCIAGELAVPFISLDLGEATILGSWGIIKSLWLYLQARGHALSHGVVVGFEDFEQMTAIGVWPGVRVLYPIHQRLIQQLKDLSNAKPLEARLKDRLRLLLGKPPLPARPKVLIFAMSESPRWLTQGAFVPDGVLEETALIDTLDEDGRLELIQYAVSKTPHKEPIDIFEVVEWTFAMMAGEIYRAVTIDAVRHARGEDREEITQDDLRAVDRELVVGGEMAQAIRPKERESCAWHESGHAYLIWKLLGDAKVRRITNKGHTGWGHYSPYYGVCAFMWPIPPQIYDQAEVIAYIMACYGGMCAEKIWHVQQGQPPYATIGVGGDNGAINQMAYILYLTAFWTKYVRLPQPGVFGYMSHSIPDEHEKLINESLDGWHDEAMKELKAAWPTITALATKLQAEEELDKYQVLEILKAGEKE